VTDAQKVDRDARSVTTMLRRALEWLANESGLIGTKINIGEHELRLRQHIGALHRVEVDSVLKGLDEQELIRYFARGEHLRGVPVAIVTTKGWQALEPIAGAGVSGVCFVAQWFSGEMDAVFESAFRPAIEDDCGLTAVRIDQVTHLNRIDDQILSEIRRAQCVVADFTGQRGGVYFEAGFALGLSRPVIWTVRRDDLASLHFDTRQYPFIDWTDVADLRSRLTVKLRALGLARKLE
jgi:hypothetical protein